jgi:hypothetical protein
MQHGSRGLALAVAVGVAALGGEIGDALAGGRGAAAGVVIAYNVSPSPRADFVVVDSNYHAAPGLLTFLYGGTGSVPVGVADDGTHYVQLNLNGHQFCILA